ncbi:MAG: hypothetical protein IJG94_12410 [Clostridia bacterium]|nr:hypothetical protein [Clostridia bacterium]
MNRTMNLKGFVLILAIALIIFLTFHLILQNSLGRKTEQERALQVALTALEEQNKDLNARLNVVGTDEYVVSSAIQNYDFMNKNDIRFEYENPEALYAYSEQEIRILMDEMTE